MKPRRRDAAAVTAVHGNLRGFPHTVGAHWQELGAEGDRSRVAGGMGELLFRRGIGTRQVTLGEARAEVRAAARTFACCLCDISLALAVCSVGIIGREDTGRATRAFCYTGLPVSPQRYAHDGLVLPRFVDTPRSQGYNSATAVKRVVQACGWLRRVGMVSAAHP